MSQEVKQVLVKLTGKTADKLEEMSEILDMPKPSCVNMLVTEWLWNNRNKIETEEAVKGLRDGRSK
jgi:hypothetical protein